MINIYKYRLTVNFSIMLNLVFIVDGNNVAFDKGKKGKIKRIQAMIEYLQSHGEVLIIISPSLRYRIDERRALESLIAQQLILQTPNGIDMNTFLLEASGKTKGLIISNDQFREYRKKYPRIGSKLLPYMMIPFQGKLEIIIPGLSSFSQENTLKKIKHYALPQVQ